MEVEMEKIERMKITPDMVIIRRALESSSIIPNYIKFTISSPETKAT